MYNLYKQLTERFKDYKFGYRDMEGLFWNIGVFDLRSKQGKTTTIEYNLPLREVAMKYAELMNSLKEPNVL